MGTRDSNSVGVETGLIDGSLHDAASKFAELEADEESGNQEPRDKLESETDDPEAEGPTGDDEESEEADDDGEDEAEDTDDESEDTDDESEDADEESEGDEEPGDDPVHTVKIDGKEQEVPLSELLKGYSRQQDYTRKTQQIAEERRAFETERQAIQEERQTYEQLLTRLEEQLTAADEPDWDQLYQDDPVAYVRAQQLHQEKQRKLDVAQREKQRLDQERQKEQAQNQQKLLADERSKLVGAVPEWSDPQVAKRELGEIVDYATGTLGFSESEIGQIVDHRAFVALRKAMSYDRLKQERSKLKTKRKPTQERTVKPGAAARAVSQSAETKVRRRLKKSGSVRDAAALFEMMPD